MYVFHDRRFEALERASDANAIAIERLVECTAFASEPEWMANSLSVSALGRWYVECPDITGVRTARRFLRAELLSLSQSSRGPHSVALHSALLANAAIDSVLDRMRVESMRSSGIAFSSSMAASDHSAIVFHAEQLASCWLASQLHPETIFRKLVGFVLDPDQKRPDSAISERLAQLVVDFESRSPQPHEVSAVVALPPSTRRRVPPSVLDVETTSNDPANANVTLRATVRGPDPLAAASRARAKFVEVVQAWRSGAHDLQAQVPTLMQVRMPNGQTVPVETRAFRVAPPRSEMTSAWANLGGHRDTRFLAVAEAMTRARDEVSQGRTAQAISTLWSAAESLVRREAEQAVAPADLEVRLGTPFAIYFAMRQFALLGVYLSMSRATKPRVRSPVDVVVILHDLVTGELQARIQGRRAFLRHRITELVRTLSDISTLQAQQRQLWHRIHLVLFGARTIRNVYMHSRVRLALDFEELYVYKWMESMLDAFLNRALSRSSNAGFDFDRYLDSLKSTLLTFSQRVAAGPPFDWIPSA